MTDTSSSGSAAGASESLTPNSAAPFTPPDYVAEGPADELNRAISTQVSSVANDGDDASDVSMTEDSDNESDDDSRTAPIIITRQSSQLMSLADDPSDASKKRKFSPDGENTIDRESYEGQDSEDHKRVKTSDSPNPPSDKSLLPAEIWQYIFTFTRPKVLGRLLQVNKKFRGYLDPSFNSTSSSVIEPLKESLLQVQSPEAVWQASRRFFYPGMPTPLQGCSEVDMWRLSCTPKCQFCSRKEQTVSPAPDKWHPGPGEDGVSPVWPFSIRSCGPCLQKNCIKERDLFSSSIPLILDLMPALPFIFLTSDLHVLSSTILQNEQQPANVQVVKWFFKSHVENIKVQLFKVQSMGTGTAEEWLKGLDDSGKEKRIDAARWERWDSSGGLQRMRATEPIEVKELFQIFKNSTSKSQIVIPKPQPIPLALHLPLKLQVATNGHHQPAPGTYSHQTVQTMSTPFSNLTPPHRFDSPSQNGFLSYPPGRQFTHTRHERTKEEVAELKAARREEIERRSMELQPPITAAVLSHMSSFQAAIQIIKPMDNNQWKVLKPRLESQRGDAEQRESDRVAQTRVQVRIERDHQDVQIKEERDAADNEWEDTQTPVRTRIGGYADEIIRDGWDGGAKVNKETCASFAADVLMYVRKRFYAEIAKDDAAARASGQQPKVDPPNGPFTQKLILENMKWVFDIKIKPHTEQYRKELFFCNGCEGINFKFYGFEGVIQHYAAKHTSALSLGSIVVHWRAEWPEIPPFNPDPTAGKSTFYLPPTSSAPYAGGIATLPQPFGYGGYPSTSAQAPAAILAQNSAGYHQSPGPYYGHPLFGDQYQRTQTGPFAPPPSFQGQPQGFPGSNYQNSQSNGYPPYRGQVYPQQNFEGSYPSADPRTFESPHPSQVFPVSMADNGGQVYPQVPFIAGGQYNPVHYAGPLPAGIHRTEEYKTQLQDIARNARELWNHTSGVKDMPGSVRVYVILFHLLQRSRAKFPDDPPLTMLIDGLSNNKDMRPVRNVNGLACRACNLEKAQGVSHAKPQGTAEKKLLSLPQLLNHFQATHVGEMQLQTYDWTKDMVELPDNTKIAALPFAQGIDEHKIRLITEALPGAFRTPTVELGSAEPAIEDLASSRDDHLSYYGKIDRSRTSGLVQDEYDDYQDASSVQETFVPLISSSHRRYEDTRTEYNEQLPVTYIERRLASPISQMRVVDDHGRQSMRDDDHIYLEPVRHFRGTDFREPGPRESERIIYDDVPRNERGYRADVPLARLLEEREGMFAANPAPRGGEVVAIPANTDHQVRGNNSSRLDSVSGPPQKSHRPSRGQNTDDGSEDGELQACRTPNVESRNNLPSPDAESAAERFLNEFQPGENAEEYAKKAEEAERRNEEALRSVWEAERIDSMRPMHQPDHETQTKDRATTRNEDSRITALSHQLPIDERERSHANVRFQQERPFQQRHHVLYEDRYVRSERRSLEPVDHRFVIDNPVERDDRPISYRAHPAAGRHAQYENIRLDHDHLGRSKSPIYVKLGHPPSQYREQSPTTRYFQQEPTYRARTPQQQPEEVQYERVPRPEYYRVYADEPRRAPARYEGQIEYVQVADSQGDYVIRRPIRREPESIRRDPEPIRREPEPIYAAYDDGNYACDPVYETRVPVSRSDPAYYEEYDPRNPAPPQSAITRQARYQ